MADLRDTLATVSGDRAFADTFFANHIEGREPIDFVSLFAQAGLSFAPRTATPFVGPIRLEPRASRVVVLSPAIAGMPLYAAGLNRDDEVISLGGQAIGSQADWDAVVRGAQSGDTLELVFESRGVEKRAPITVSTDPRYTLVPVESTGGTLSDAQRTFRDAWFVSHAR